MLRAANRRKSPARLPLAIMLLAALAFVLHGLLAPGMQAQARMAAAAGHEHGTDHQMDCHKLPSTGDAGHTAHHQASDPTSPDGLPAVPIREDAAGHQMSCCTPFGAAVIPQPAAITRGLLRAERLELPALALPPGIVPEGPRKPPRTNDQG